MRNGHRITITAASRCGTCARPVGWNAFRTRYCDCRQLWAAGWDGECDHIVSFLRHWPERRDCPVCKRPRVAVMADGSLWWHKWPGYGLWSDGADCKGLPGRWPGGIVPRAGHHASMTVIPHRTRKGPA